MSVYRRAHLLTLRPPLAFGGHCWVVLDGDPWLERCLGCHAVLPVWMVSEGYWATEAGRWCPDFLAALPRAL